MLDAGGDSRGKIIKIERKQEKRFSNNWLQIQTNFIDDTQTFQKFNPNEKTSNEFDSYNNTINVQHYY